jgi:uncharacterized membrane protein YbhN (UPF0104 family)
MAPAWQAGIDGREGTDQDATVSRPIVRLVVGIAVSVLAVILLLGVVDVPGTLALLRSVDPGWLVLPLLSLAVQFTLRGIRWTLLLRSVTVEPVAVRGVLGPLSAGYLANAVLPARIGEVVRGVLVSRRQGLPIGPVAASIVVERMIDLAALFSIGIVVMGTQLTLGWPIVVGAIGSAVATIAVIVLGPGLADRVPRALPAGIRAPLAQPLASLAGVRLPVATAAYGLSVVAWFGDAILFWSCARAVGLDLAPADAMVIAIGAALGTALPAASGYVGTYELGVVALASLVGIGSESALAVALLAHFLAIVPMAMVGLAYTVRTGVRWGLSDAAPRWRLGGDPQVDAP